MTIWTWNIPSYDICLLRFLPFETTCGISYGKGSKMSAGNRETRRVGSVGGMKQMLATQPRTDIYTHIYKYISVYIYIVYLPLWKIWVRQLGLWNSQLNGKIKHVPNHQPHIYICICVYISIYIYININQTITIWLWLNGFVLECPDINRDINLDTHTLKTHSLQFKKNNVWRVSKASRLAMKPVVKPRLPPRIGNLPKEGQPVI